MLSLKKVPNPDAVVIRLLKLSGANVDPEKVIADLEKHPDYPSLLAISDVLDYFKIKNAAYRIDSANLADVPCPFIVHTTVNGGDFLVVEEMKDNSLVVSNESWKRYRMTMEEFKKMFKGVVLTAEHSSDPAAAGAFPAVAASVKTPLIAAGLLILLAAALSLNGFFTGLSRSFALLAVIKTTGLATSILLLVQSIDSNNPLVQKLCQSSSKTNCNAILSSKAAKVFEGLTWSEVGFFYFAGTWLLLLFAGRSAAVWEILAILNIVSLPYTIYSIYYQARVARQWCVLCCTIQALLWLEFGTLLSGRTFNGFSNIGISSTMIEALLICMAAPVLLWLLLKPLLLDQQQLNPLKRQLRKFKYNTELFNTIVAAQPKYAQPEDEWSIVLGNVEANSIITMVSNPYCQPCAKMHKALHELLQLNGNVQARIIFTADNTDADRKTAVARHMMALNELPDKTIVIKALNDWYEQKQKDYAAWAKVYPVQLREANFYKLEKQHDWCKMAEITATPTMLLNGHRLPDLYQLPDLKYMLE
ncbi:MAG TPA: vitamin K epoxide reductase family protein [Mucilaginibacter sp.]|nr:vitamin K epoxide reductase family protein [Mucilaginibacter sp.]